MPIPHKFKLNLEVIITPDLEYTSLDWNKLSMRDRAAFIRLRVANGDTDIDSIHLYYNEFKNGGDIEETVKKVNSSNANFVLRLKDPNRKYIQDWASNNIATHKLSVGTDSNGNHYIYPEVQEINGKLVDFTRPPYADWLGRAAAEERGDTVRIPSILQAIEFTENYKRYYPKGNTFDKGGDLYNDDSDLVDFLIKEEGFLNKPTDIGDGKITIGSGLTDPKWIALYNKKGRWSKEDNRRAVAEEVTNRRKWAENNIPNWDNLPESSLKALLSYKYNYNFTPKNSPKLFKALSDGNLYEAAILMNATSKNPKFKKGLEERRKRELDWFMKDIMESPTKIIVELPAVSTRVDDPFVLQTNNTSIAPLMVPDEDAYVKSHRLTKEEDSYNKAAKLLENVIRFNKLMEALNILNNIIPKFIPLFTLPFTNINLPKALGGNLFEEGGYKAPWVLEAEEREAIRRNWLEEQAAKYAQSVENAKHPTGHYLNEIVVTPNGNSIGSVSSDAMLDNLQSSIRERQAKDRIDASNMIRHIHEGTNEAAKWLAPLVLAPAAGVIAKGLPTLVDNPVTQAAFKFVGRPTSSLAEGLAYYTPNVSKATPYTVGFDKALMTTLGIEGVKDAATKWYNNEMPWYQAVPQAGLSGLMIAGETAPLISKGVKTAVNAVNSSRIPWVSSIPENENMAYRIMGPLEKDWLLQGNELSTRATNALTEAEEAAARIAVPKGRRFILFKAGAEHGGRKQFAKGQTWKGTTTTHGEPQVLAIPGKNLPWKSGRHYRGPQGHGFKVGDVSFEEAPFGSHIDLQANTEGFTGINPSTLEGSTIYSPINLFGHNFGYRTYRLSPVETRNTPQIMAGISEQPPLNTVDYTYNPTLNDTTIDVFKKMRQKQYQLMLSGDKTFNPTDEYSLINPRDLGTVFPVPDEAKQIILNSTIPRMLAMRPWMSQEELNNRLTELTNTTYTEFPEVTLREAYPNDEFMLSLKGAYNPENDFIKLIEGNDANYVMPHEVRHRIDFHEPLVEAEENFLENAYGEVFRNLPNHTKSLKGYKNMEDEMVTTNLDARTKLIGTLHAKKTDPQLLNKIIDKAKDEDIVKAVREANGYGRAFIEQLEASNQLTPERIKAFREAMKYVGMLSVPVVLLQSAQKQKNISNNK